jgi:hypothetical protein
MGYLHISARRTPETSGSSASRLPCMAPPCALPMAPQTMRNNWDYKDSVIGAACNPHKVQVRTRGLAHVRHNGTDISFLGDQHLRALVGRLCEARTAPKRVVTLGRHVGGTRIRRMVAWMFGSPPQRSLHLAVRLSVAMSDIRLKPRTCREARFSPR